MTVQTIQYHYMARDGSEPSAESDHGALAAFVPTGGSDQTIAIGTVTQPDIPRSVTVTLTDANASITQVKVYIKGLSFGGAVQEETLTLLAAGTVESNRAYRVLTDDIIYHVDGVVTAIVDTLEIGYSNRIGLPDALAAEAEIWVKQVDGAVDVGTVDMTYKTWEPTGGNQPDGAKVFILEAHLNADWS